ncbi:DNA/RNA non-specific endonuclease [Oleiharenicola lentus]|uniref:DNA/RNA non-specific endonuclease n=1 Tax=Oleiharenicola lentus TaxID=2508720 RepID=UPI003F6818A7
MARKSKSASKSRGGSGGKRLGAMKKFLTLNIVLWGVIGGWYLFQPKPRQEEVSRLVGNLFDSKKSVTAVDVAWDLWQLYYSEDFVNAPVSTTATSGNTPLYGGLPQTATLNTAPVRVLRNIGYTVGYSDALGNPLWAAYRLRDMTPLAAPPRPEKFSTDTRTVAQIDEDNYTRSGFDRGHLAPNFAIATYFGGQAQEETFLMSNITPQKHGLNAGLWKSLEQKIATNYPGRFGEIWVIAGPIFGRYPARLKRRVAVPEAFFMIIVDESDGRVRAQAFIFPQETASAQLDAYLATIDEIERRTALNFLSELPDNVENALEAHRVARVW